MIIYGGIFPSRDSHYCRATFHTRNEFRLQWNGKRRFVVYSPIRRNMVFNCTIEMSSTVHVCICKRIVNKQSKEEEKCRKKETTSMLNNQHNNNQINWKRKPFSSGDRKSKIKCGTKDNVLAKDTNQLSESHWHGDDAKYTLRIVTRGGTQTQRNNICSPATFMVYYLVVCVICTTNTQI